jgi:hypothetical protein
MSNLDLTPSNGPLRGGVERTQKRGVAVRTTFLTLMPFVMHQRFKIIESRERAYS